MTLLSSGSSLLYGHRTLEFDGFPSFPEKPELNKLTNSINSLISLISDITFNNTALYSPLILDPVPQGIALIYDI